MIVIVSPTEEAMRGREIPGAVTHPCLNCDRKLHVAQSSLQTIPAGDSAVHLCVQCGQLAAALLGGSWQRPPGADEELLDAGLADVAITDARLMEHLNARGRR